MTIVYNFHEKLQQGKEAEDIIREFLEDRYICNTKDATAEEDRLGIDFWWYINTQIIACQVKYEDYVCHANNAKRCGKQFTGNIALETYSVYPTKRGCHWEGMSDYTFHLYADGWILMFYTQRLQKFLRANYRDYPEKNICNEGYESRVRLVPFADSHNFKFLRRIYVI